MEDLGMNNAPMNTDAVNFANKVANHRKMMEMILSSRFKELLPHLISYRGLPKTVSRVQLETLLRQTLYGVLVGKDLTGTLTILGVANNVNYNFYNYPRVTSIKWLIPEANRPKIMEQITPQVPKGNFVLVRNRPDNTYISDYDIIDAYSEHLAEIKASRYSLSLQGKAIMYFKGVDPENNHRLNNTISAFLNGDPVIKVDSAIDLTTEIGSIEGTKTIPQLMVSLKDEYSNIYNEMLNLLGILNLGVDKASGVNMIESNANQGVLNAVSNIYIQSRQDAFNLLKLVHEDVNVVVGYDNDINLEENGGK